MPSDHRSEPYVPSPSESLAVRLAHGILGDARAARTAVDRALRELTEADGQADWLRLLERVRALAGRIVRDHAAGANQSPDPRTDHACAVDLPFDTMALADAYASLPDDEQNLLWSTLLCRPREGTSLIDLAAAIGRLSDATAQRALPSEEDIPSNEDVP